MTSRTLAVIILFACLSPLPVDVTTPPTTPPTAAASKAATIKPPALPDPLPPGAVVYGTLTGREAQVTSAAPLERIVGKSSAVVGFAIPGPADGPAKLVAASWVLPVKSLATGLPLRDEHMAGPAWLDAARHPTLQFALTRVGAIKQLKRGEGFTTWSVTLVGAMTIHGVTREIQVADARLSFLDESEKTRSIAPGNLIFLKCDYSVTLSDYGIRHADVPIKVSDTVELSQMLRMSDATKVEGSREGGAGRGEQGSREQGAAGGCTIECVGGVVTRSG